MNVGGIIIALLALCVLTMTIGARAQSWPRALAFGGLGALVPVLVLTLFVIATRGPALNQLALTSELATYIVGVFASGAVMALIGRAIRSIFHWSK